MKYLNSDKIKYRLGTRIDTAMQIILHLIVFRCVFVSSVLFSSLVYLPTISTSTIKGLILQHNFGDSLLANIKALQVFLVITLISPYRYQSLAKIMISLDLLKMYK